MQKPHEYNFFFLMNYRIEQCNKFCRFYYLWILKVSFWFFIGFYFFFFEIDVEF
jgi:hypothetical protein